MPDYINTDPWGPVLEAAAVQNGLPSQLLNAIADQENVDPRHNNPLGLSSDEGVHTYAPDQAVDHIYRQARLLTSRAGPYAKFAATGDINDLAAVYSPVGASNDVNGTNATEAAGIQSALAKRYVSTDPNAGKSYVSTDPNAATPVADIPSLPTQVVAPDAQAQPGFLQQVANVLSQGKSANQMDAQEIRQHPEFANEIARQLTDTGTSDTIAGQVAPLVETLKQGTSALQIPEAFSPQQPTQLRQAGAAIANLPADTWNFLMSPEGLATVASVEVGGPLWKSLVSAGFSSQALTGAIDAAKRGDVYGLTQALGIAALTGKGANTEAGKAFPVEKPAPSVQERTPASILNVAGLDQPDLVKAMVRRSQAAQAVSPELVDQAAQQARQATEQPTDRITGTESPSPELESAVDKALRLSSPTPLRSAAEIAQEAPSPAQPVSKGIPLASKAAEDYVRTTGIGQILPPSEAKVDVNRAQQIAQDYENLPEVDNSPETQASYNAFANEVDAQFQHAQEQGIKFEFTKDDPYKSSADMMADLRDNGRLKVYTGGSDHPYLGSSTVDENGLTINDKFRAVHDLYGHASEGNQFGPIGEERAWRKHAAMFSEEARPAMTTETRGQNSWVNYGPQMFNEYGWRGDKTNPDYLPPSKRPFAQQKAALLPPEHSQIAPSIDEIASHVVKSTNESGGATISLAGEKPTTGFSFAPDKSTEVKIPADQFNTQTVKNYIRRHFEKLRQPGAHLGAWKDANGVPTLDISIISANRDEALRRAAEGQQEAIYDLRAGQEIPVTRNPAVETGREAGTGVSAQVGAAGNERAVRGAGSEGVSGVSAANEYTEGRRAALGLEPRRPVVSQADADIDAQAARVLSEDPLAANRLAEELRANPRATKDALETALLRKRVAQLEKQHSDLIDEINATGDPAAQERLHQVRDELQNFYEAAEKSGTELARSFRQRQVAEGERYSLPRMEAETRAIANGGDALSDKQLRQVRQAHARIDSARKRLAAREQELSEGPVKQAMPKTRKGVMERLDKLADQAMKNIEERRGRLQIGIDPQALSDEAIVGARYIAHKVDDFGKWSQRMAKHIGEKSDDYMRSLYENAKRVYNDFQGPIGAARQFVTKFNVTRTNIESDFFGKVWPKLLKETGLTARTSNVRFAAMRAVNDVAGWLKDNPRFADYYNEDMKTNRALLDEGLGKPVTDEEFLVFRLLNGLFSNQTPLGTNTAESINGLKLFRDTGSLDGFDTFINPATGFRKFGNAPFSISGKSAAIKTFAVDVVNRLIKEHGSVEAAVKYLQEPVTMKELNAFNKQVGFKGNVTAAGAIKTVVRQATGQDQMIPRMFIFGKKVGAYTLNNLGDHTWNTTDVWESRFIKSYFNGLLEKNTGIANDAAEHDLFEDFVKEFNDIWHTKVNPNAESSALQAARWFYILDSAKEAGYTRSITNETISGYVKQYFERESNRGLDTESGRASDEASRAEGASAEARPGIVDYLNSAADRAWERKKERWQRLTTQAPINPADLADTAIIGAAKLATIGRDFGKWSAEMVSHVGEWIRPHLQEVYQKAQEYLDQAHQAYQEKRLKSLTTRKLNQTQQLREAVATGTPIPKVERLPLELDPKARQIVADYEKAKYDYEAMLEEARLKNRPTSRKVVDTLVDLSRAMKLSSLNVFGKLGGAGVQRIGQNVLEDVAGTGLRYQPFSKSLREAMKQAPTEGAPTVKSTLAYGRGLAQGTKQVVTQLPEIFTKRGPNYDVPELTKYEGQRVHVPSLLDIPGRLHGAEKQPFKVAQTQMAIEKAIRAAAARGEDVTKPDVAKTIERQANQAGLRGIMMNDNVLSKAWGQFVNYLENNKIAPRSGYVASRVAKLLVPVVRVGPNIAIEWAHMNSMGLPGAFKLAEVMKRGMFTIKPEEADFIARSLKKGAVGAALFALGYFNRDNLGGLYQPGLNKKERQQRGDIKPLEARVLGVHVPWWFSHTAAALQVQLGATVGKLVDQNKPKAQASLAVANELLNEVPFLNASVEIDKMIQAGAEGTKARGRFVQGNVVPQVVRNIAQHLDSAEKRYPQNELEYVMEGIPGLREQLSETPPMRRRRH